MAAIESYRLSSLEIDNFRQYRRASIKFSQDPNKTFTILRGVNGAGKTNIMNAITWCLYGTEKHLSNDEKDLPIVNTSALDEKPNGLLTMKVGIVLSDDNGAKFMIERRLRLLNSGKKNIVNDKDTGIPIPEGSTPSIKSSFQRYIPDSGWESTEYFDKSVKDLLPKDLATYFLFDGEKLEDFFEHIDDTKKGIEDVSQIKITEMAIETMTKLVSQKRRDAKNLAPQAQQYQEQMAEVDDKLASAKKEIETISANLTAKESRVREIEQSIAKAGGDVGEYQQEANGIKHQIEFLEEQYANVVSHRQDYVLNHMFIIQMLSSIDETLDYIHSKSDEGTLPPKIRNTFLDELLAGGCCICGNDISVGTESRAQVRSLLNKVRYSEISEICNELKYELKPMRDVNDIKLELNRKESDKLGFEDERKKLKDKLADIEAKIGSADIDEIKKLHNEKLDLSTSIGKLNENLARNKLNRDDLIDQLDKFSRAYDRELRKDDKHKHLIRQLDFCENALSNLKKIKDELLEDVRIKVERYTTKYFLKFLWKKDTYDNVTISDAYKIVAHHVHGYNVRTSLSKGEKLVLALSFMAALRKITGFGFPLMIDTPFGRVSGEPRHNIALSLPTFLKSTQVTLLVTDSEYQAQIQDDDNQQKFPSIRETIKENVGADYSIVFENGESRVMKN